MDSWHVCRISVTLATDVHCGESCLGFISRTLPFVPAHIPLYAMVPALVTLKQLPTRQSSYDQALALLEQGVRFTPFFIADVCSDHEQTHERILFPWEDVGINRIETYYLGSKYGVALDYDIRGALENRLFEMEAIMAQKRENGQRTKLVGYCFWRHVTQNGFSIDNKGNCCELPLIEVIKASQWGGERNKGYGKLMNVEIQELVDDMKVFEAPVQNRGVDYPVIHWSSDRPAPFYLEWSEEIASKVRGQIRPLVGRRFAPGQGPGLTTDRPLIAWDLGWQINGDSIAFMLRGIRSVNHLP